MNLPASLPNVLMAAGLPRGVSPPAAGLFFGAPCFHDSMFAGRLSYRIQIAGLEFGTVCNGMSYIAASLGYAEPVPVDPKDELAELIRQSIEANRETQRRQERIERLLQPSLRAA